MPTLTRKQFESLMSTVKSDMKKKMRRQFIYGKKVQKIKTMTRPEKLMMQRLASQKRTGVILNYAYEPIKLELGKRCTYTPDFIVDEIDGTKTIIETKGAYIREDSIIKLKWAAEKFKKEYKVKLFIYKNHQWIEREMN